MMVYYLVAQLLNEVPRADIPSELAKHMGALA